MIGRTDHEQVRKGHRLTSMVATGRAPSFCRTNSRLGSFFQLDVSSGGAAGTVRKSETMAETK